MAKTYKTCSLFCGIGGEHLGLQQALDQAGIDNRMMYAIDHWDRAIDVFSQNFPETKVFQEDLFCLTPESIGIKELDVLWFSAPCTHYSRARGGVPKENQMRCFPNIVLSCWIKPLLPNIILMENVPEIESWGSLTEDGTQDINTKGQHWNRFLSELKILGYNVEYKILTACDYGDPTTRKRLFLQAKKGRIQWPNKTNQSPDSDGNLPHWRTAGECIDWHRKCPTIRGRNLSANTIKRIEHGIKKYWGKDAEHFLLGYYSRENAVSKIDSPVPTLTTENRFALISPFLFDYYKSSENAKPLNRPSPTLTTHERLGVVQPLILAQYGGNGYGNCKTTDMPIPTITSINKNYLIKPDMLTLDIGFRMLEPNELSRMMGFPDNFKLPSVKKDAVRMIGNACPVNTTRNFIAAAIKD